MADAPIYSRPITKVFGCERCIRNAEVVGSSPARGSQSIIASIRTLAEDRDSFIEDELPPSPAAIEFVNSVLTGAGEKRAKIPRAEIGMFYGELNLTWRVQNRVLKLVVYSDNREPLLYFQTDNGEVLTRGQSVRPATTDALTERLNWVLLGMDHASVVPVETNTNPSRGSAVYKTAPATRQTPSVINVQGR